jgi:hypothetical protein
VSIRQCLLNWFETSQERILVELFELGACDVDVKVMTVEQRVDLDRRLQRLRQHVLGVVALGS